VVKTVALTTFAVSVFGIESFVGIESVCAKTAEPIKESMNEKAIVFVFIFG